MAKHLHDDLNKIKQQLLALGALVEEAVKQSILAFQNRDKALAEKVIEQDNAIDSLEVELEELCLKVLALQQPVAQDLRFIAATLKINNDLERIGDCAVHIAKRCKSLAKGPAIAIPAEITKMSEAAQGMVHEALDAFVRMDVELAQSLAKKDDVVDECNHTIIRRMRRLMHDKPDLVDQALDVFTATRRIERSGDLATNIAEDVVYLVKGEIVRHKG